ncbi:hypothetical protein H5J24_14845 [Chryseobacterium capnotolerans]|uniref:hypothetical protein n=1 Tax=Chryseobacterium TaxID=59732 RepID=UPI00083A3108|nr:MULTISPECIES: hypothetical protein [Chryseobacterium]UHO37035.1 hypothetical protein H5J24_14845 [Chryseobacterium capnotolerans]
MKNLILILLISIFIPISCQQKKDIKQENTTENKNIIDSAFLGDPKIINENYINNIQSEEGFTGYNTIEKSLNKIQKNLSTLKGEKNFQINNLTFKLTKSKNAVRLYTISNNKTIDSLKVYQNITDKQFDDQKFATLFYLEEGKYLWILNVVINTSEQVVSIVSYKKYKVSEDGKFLNENAYIENKSLQQLFQSFFT